MEIHITFNPQIHHTIILSTFQGVSLRGFGLSQWCCWSFSSSGMLVCVTGRVFRDVPSKYREIQTRLQRHERDWIFCVVTNGCCYNKGLYCCG